MSRSFKKPYLKGKNRWFQKYKNRRERLLAKKFIRAGDYETPEFRITPSRDYDVVDWVWKPYGLNRSRLEKFSRK